MDEETVWDACAGAEKLIAILKFRLDYETPGLVSTLPKADEPTELVRQASELFSRSAAEIGRGNLVQSIETLRQARNNLRSYLTKRRVPATRRKARS